MTIETLSSAQGKRLRSTIVFILTAVAGAIFTALSGPLELQSEYMEPYSTWPIGLPSLLAAVFIFGGPIFYLILVLVLWRRSGVFAIIPFVLCIGTGLAVFTSNLSPSNWWLNYNEWHYHEQRMALYRQVALGKARSGATTYDAVTYDPGLMLAQAGEAAVLKQTPQGPLVLFQTFSGIPDGMSGFIYVPPGIDPISAWPELELKWADKFNDEGTVYFARN